MVFAEFSFYYTILRHRLVMAAAVLLVVSAGH